VRFSVWFSPGRPWEDVLAAAQHAEATGWDGLWYADHFMGPGRDGAGSLLECWTVVSALGAVVPRVRVGPLVAGNTYRHPAVLANMAATLDRVTGGRLVLGLGAGWQRNEHEKYGIEFFDVPGRLGRLEEACQMIRALSSEDRATFEGRFYQLTEAPMEPKGLRRPLPLLIGGGGERRTLRIAATYAAEWNTWGTPEVLAHKGKVLDQHCEAIGRDPATIVHSCQALVHLGDDPAWLAERRADPPSMPTLVGSRSELVDVMGAYAEAGVSEFILPDWTLPANGLLDGLDRFMNEVAVGFR
jgi:F420-dependent oxidoreductase-like protein